ncbi:hypothetical protein N9980_01975, partial [bacterium]|nr:hypothetical protein [bacterium]
FRGWYYFTVERKRDLLFLMLSRWNSMNMGIASPLSAGSGAELPDDVFSPNPAIYDGGQVFSPTLSGEISPDLVTYDGGQVFAPDIIGTIVPVLVSYDGGTIFAPTLFFTGGTFVPDLVSYDGGEVFAPIINGAFALDLVNYDGGTIFAPSMLAEGFLTPNRVDYDGGVIFAPEITAFFAPDRADYDGGTIFAPTVVSSGGVIIPVLVTYDGGTIFTPTMNGSIVPSLVTYDGGTIFAPTVAAEAAAEIVVEDVQSFDNDDAGADAAIQDLIVVSEANDTGIFDINIPASLGSDIAVVLVVAISGEFIDATSVVSSGTLGSDSWTVSATNLGTALASDKSISLLHLALGNSPTSGDRTCTLNFDLDIVDSNNGGFQDSTIQVVAYILSGANQTGLDQTAFTALTFIAPGFEDTGAGVTPTNDDSLVIVGAVIGGEVEIDPTTVSVTYTERNTAARPLYLHCADFIQGTAAAVSVDWEPATGGSTEAHTFALSIALA